MGSLISLKRGSILASLLMAHIILWGQKKAEWQNLQVLEQNKVAARSSFFAYENQNTALSFQPKRSRNYLSLNGKWSFFLAEKLSYKENKFYKQDFDPQFWGKITVPSNWELQGYGTPKYLRNSYEFQDLNSKPPEIPTEENIVGQYRRTFQLPQAWQGKSVFIQIGSVSSACYVWVNGFKVGYAEGSSLPIEFDLTDYVQPGDNTIAIEVYKWSNSSYLECHDSWRLSGLEGDIFLFARPKVRIKNISVESFINRAGGGQLVVEAYLQNKSEKDVNSHWLQIQLLAPNQVFLQENASSQMVKLNLQSEDLLIFDQRIDTALDLWSAETPHLYTLLLNLHNDEGTVIESVPLKIGFRNIEIKDGQLLINNKAARLYGVNYQIHDPDVGRAVTPEVVERDLQLMKTHNLNAIRTLGEPHPSFFYDLCDRYGFYVIDEANIESEGISFEAHQTLGNNPDWGSAHLSRLKNMVARDRNHPSIILWSLGNEAGNGVNFYEMYRWLEQNDRKRPIIYEGARKEWNTDILCLNNPTVEEVKNYSASNEERPFMISQLGPAWGNSLGGLYDYWGRINQLPKFQGIFLTSWKDGALRLPEDEKLPLIYTHPNWESSPDSNFAIKGLVSADQQPHPILKEVKKIFQPISVEEVDLTSGQIVIENNYQTQSLDDFSLYWSILEDGKAIQSGTILDLLVYAGEREEIQIPYVPFEAVAGCEYLLNLSFQIKSKNHILPQKTEVAWEQFPLDVFRPAKERLTDDMPKLKLARYKKEWIISSEDFKLVFDRSKGIISSFIYKTKELFVQGPQPIFWRASTPIEKHNGLDQILKPWKGAHQRMYVKQACYEKVSNSLIRIGVDYRVPPENIRCRLIYAIYSTGDVIVDYRLNFPKTKDPLPPIPRVGMYMGVKEEFSELAWYGRGPDENYANRKYGMPLGYYEQNINQSAPSYLIPQEYGHLTDMRWMNLMNDRGRGLAIVGMPNFEVNVSPYHIEKLSSGEKAHFHELEKDMANYVYIDFQQMGVPSIERDKPLDESYQIPANRPYRFHFRLSPIHKDKVPREVVRQSFDMSWMPGLGVEELKD